MEKIQAVHKQLEQYGALKTGNNNQSAIRNDGGLEGTKSSEAGPMAATSPAKHEFDCVHSCEGNLRAIVYGSVRVGGVPRWDGFDNNDVLRVEHVVQGSSLMVGCRWKLYAKRAVHAH